MKLSIVLCTYNNSNSLALTLSEISACEIPSEYKNEIELLCIDNNSTDDTREIFIRSQSKFSFISEYHHERNQGLSHARNLGLKLSKGEYILFTDDDAKIPSNWIQQYLDAIKEFNPDCLFSKIEVLWDQPKPWWFIPEYNPFFVNLDYGNKPLKVDDLKHEFFGKNFCVRKIELERIEGFNPKLGRCGNKLIAGEETLIYKNLIKEKKQVYYIPSAPVGHRLKDREYKYSNIRKLHIDSAYSQFHLSKATSSKRVLNRPIYPLKSALLTILLSSYLLIVKAVFRNREKTILYRLRILKSLKVLSLWVLNP